MYLPVGLTPASRRVFFVVCTILTRLGPTRRFDLRRVISFILLTQIMGTTGFRMANTKCKIVPRPAFVLINGRLGDAGFG